MLLKLTSRSIDEVIVATAKQADNIRSQAVSDRGPRRQTGPGEGDVIRVLIEVVAGEVDGRDARAGGTGPESNGKGGASAGNEGGEQRCGGEDVGVVGAILRQDEASEVGGAGVFHGVGEGPGGASDEDRTEAVGTAIGHRGGTA